MAVSADMNASPSAPQHGETITVVYEVTGNDPIDPTSAQITGRVIVGGNPLDVATAITMPGTPAQSVTYETPVCAGLTFVSTPNNAVFTAVIP